MALSRLCLASFALAALPYAFSQEVTGPAEGPPWKITGFADALYSANFNAPASGANQFYNFNASQGFDWNGGGLIVERDGDRFGVLVEAGYGEMFRIMNLSDPWGGPNRYVSQAIFTYKIRKNSGWRLGF
jgi:hypothetical protein